VASSSQWAQCAQSPAVLATGLLWRGLAASSPTARFHFEDRCAVAGAGNGCDTGGFDSAPPACVVCGRKLCVPSSSGCAIWSELDERLCGNRPLAGKARRDRAGSSMWVCGYGGRPTPSRTLLATGLLRQPLTEPYAGALSILIDEHAGAERATSHLPSTGRPIWVMATWAIS
jgi:hypothetical protein